MSAPLSPTLAGVVDGQLCVGCGLCAALAPEAIAMERSVPRGYRRPVVMAAPSPAVEATIAATCPGVVVAAWPAAASVDPLWGPIISAYTGYAQDAEIRHAGSSGGVLSGLLLHMLESRQIDRVVHVGMDADAPLLTSVARSFGRDDILRTAGSRYAPVSPLEGITAELAAGGRFAFIGKPCDVSALRLLGEHDSRVATHVAIMLSFFCAGTPSQAGTDRIIARLGANRDRLTSFRYRGDGWPGYATATEADGRVTRISYAASWGDILSKEVQYRCKICPDAVGGVADIACADAWYGGESGYPTFDEADGRSLVLVRTAAGATLLEHAVSRGAIATEPLETGEIIKMQPHQARRKRLVRSRVAALVATLQQRPNFAGTRVTQAAKAASLGQELRSFLGSVRRILLDKR